MARFIIAAHGQQFEIEAPDQNSAIAAFDAMTGGDSAPPAQAAPAADPYDNLPVPGNPDFNPQPNDWQNPGGGPLSVPVLSSIVRSLYPAEYSPSADQYRLAVPSLFRQDQGGTIPKAIGDTFGDAASLPGRIVSGETPLDPRLSVRDQNPKTLDEIAVLAGAISGTPSLASKGMVPQTAHGLVDAAGRAMPKAVADTIEIGNIAPASLAPRLAEAGQGAILGDLTPQLQMRVGAVANTPGPGQDMLVEALRARQRGANLRIQGQLDQSLGPAPIPSRVAVEVAANRGAAAEGYAPVFAEKALSDNYLMDAAPIAEAIDAVIPNVVGNTRRKVESVRAMLIDPRTGGFTQDPQVILAIRQELDGMIAGETNPTTQGRLGDLRRAIDQDLASQVPGLKAVDAGVEQQALQQEGFDLGRRALRPGDNPMHPVDLEDALAAGSVPNHAFIGPSGVPVRIQQGMIAHMAEIVGNKVNDRLALRDLLRGEGSWNREKLVTAFGEETANRLVRLFDNEANMATTENLAFGGSKTAGVRAAQEGIADATKQPGVVRSALNFNFGDALANAADFMVGGMSKKGRMSRNAEIAQALLSQGGWRPGPVSQSNGGLLAPLTKAALAQAIIEQGKKGGVNRFLSGR